MTFEDWWKQANDGADTADKDSKYPMVKELAQATWEAAQQNANTEMAQCLIDGLTDYGRERLFAGKHDKYTYDAYLIARDVLKNNPQENPCISH